MDDDLLWYLSGAVDSLANLKLSIKKRESKSLGYQAQSVIEISRPNSRYALLGMLEDYCNERGIRYYISDYQETTKRFELTRPDSIERFLKPIAGGFIQQPDNVEVMLSEVIPIFKESTEFSKQEFIELARLSEKLQRSGRKSKYDTDYFESEWGISAE